jgi:broad specificity phosphatase PhoE
VLRLLLLRHGPTATTASATFGDDGELTQRGFQQAASLDLPRVHRVALSPALVAASTARAVELADEAEVDRGLADWDPGRWRGRSLDDLTESEPAGVAAWLGDPAAAPHGGESLQDVLARTAAWLARIAGPAPQSNVVERAEVLERAAGGPGNGTVLAITHAAIVRAAVVTVLQAPAAAFWALDVAPLSLTELRHRDGRWHLRGFGR